MGPVRNVAAAVALFALAASPAASQPVQNVGTASSFDIATWNIEWFGSTGGGPSDETRQQDNVFAIIEGAGIDLWALQEISSIPAFNALVARLGAPWTGEVAPFTQTQRTAYLWRTDVVQKLSARLILDQFASAFGGRPPFELKALVTLPDTTFTVTLVNVHMKAFADLDSYNQRLEASQRLKNRFDLLEASTNLVLLGDLNDELGPSISTGRDSPYRNFLDDPSRYRFLSKPLDDAGVCTFCGSELSTIDHILVSNELYPLADRGATDRLGSVLTGDRFYIVYTSDHVPVYARLQGPLPVAAERAPDPRLAAVDAWPIPVRGTLRVSLPRSAGTARRVELVDLLGRRVAIDDSGSGLVDFDGGALAPGLYVLLVDGRPARTIPVL